MKEIIYKYIIDKLIATKEQLKYTKLKLFLENDKLIYTKTHLPSQKERFIKTEEIILCEADGYCTRFYISGKKQTYSTHLLKYYEEVLPNRHFMRVHNSYIINIDHVIRFTTQGEIILSEDLHCPLSHSRKVEFLKIFKHLI